MMCRNCLDTIDPGETIEHVHGKPMHADCAEDAREAAAYCDCRYTGDPHCTYHGVLR